MDREFTANIITAMKRHATHWRFLLVNHLDKEKLLEALSSHAFFEILHVHVASNDFSCTGLMKAYEVIYEQIFHGTIADNFLEHAYQYTLSLSFPDAVTVDLGSDLTGYALYLNLLRTFNDFQKKSNDGTFMSVYPFELLSHKEVLDLEDQKEYTAFQEAFEHQYVYEMMKLNYEVTGHSTIEHILGVHYLAMKIARQLKASGMNIDLGRVSGAAAGHDIGKFGCRPEESHKIAYYHYYYTDVWFRELNIHYIKNVAVYHSTWDLELESLSIESLVLIFADFCVKRSKDKPGLFKMKFLNVDESFKVILNKLDNVDEKKKQRYERVYQKLKNFHDFLLYKGVVCTVENYTGQPLVEDILIEPLEYDTLSHGEAVTQHVKIMAIEKSVRLMHRLRHVDSLNEIIQDAKVEKDILMFRRYLSIFEEYSTYLTPEQKLLTIDFLSSYMIHAEEDIRKISSVLIGRLIADYDENYTKELPERAHVVYTVETKFNIIVDKLNDFIFQDVRMAPIKRQRQVSSYRYMMMSLFEHVDEAFAERMKDMILSYYEQQLDEYSTLFLLELMDLLLEKSLSEENIDVMMTFVMNHLEDEGDLQIMAYAQLHDLLKSVHGNQVYQLLKNSYDLSCLLSKEDSIVHTHLLRPLYDLERKAIICDIHQVKSEMFLSNLKSATSKVVKHSQIEMLYDYAMRQGNEERFYTAMHFCNILKVSDHEYVRNTAGECLVALFGKLSSEQKNDIVVELIRALEIEGYGFTRYIPHFLGQLIPTLEMKEYSEIIDDIKYKISNASIHIRVLLLDTLGTMIQKWLKLESALPVEPLLGCLFNGFYSGNKLTTQMAFNVLSKDIIGNQELSLNRRYEIYGLIYKKLHVFLTDTNQTELDIFNYSVGLHYFYHFITDYQYVVGDMIYKAYDRVAFYSGTFDPFSLGQKSAAKDAISLGMEVYINISEFQWKRRTQPTLMRKQIVDMSISDEMNIYTFPQNQPINLQEPSSLDQLRSIFKGRKVYLIIGEEALIHDSKYKDLNHEIYKMPHIIYKRESIKQSEAHKALIASRIDQMEDDVVIRPLEYKYEMIDVEQIRRNIDRNWDAYDVIDDLATHFIRRKNLYRNEPQFKSIVPLSDVKLRCMPLSEFDEMQLYQTFEIEPTRINALKNAELDRYIFIVEEHSTKKILACSIYAKALKNHLFDEIRSLEVLQEITALNCEKVMIIDEILMNTYEEIHALDQIILTETLTQEIKNGCDYAVLTCHDPYKFSKNIKGVLIRSGFVERKCLTTEKMLYSVDMREPIVINLDGTTRMKADYRQHEDIRNTIKLVRSSLQQAVVDLYPNCLVLSFDRSMLYNHLIRNITNANEVPLNDCDTLGSMICVPYGDIFKRWLLPNTVTKAFHTERYFDEAIAHYDVKAYPGYGSIEDQASVLKAYNQPVILVDDLVDKGHRLDAINEHLKQANIDVREVIVGILSDRGKAHFEEQNIIMTGAYYIPKIKVWFNESDVYPFIGGDSVSRKVKQPEHLMPSANLMLPFVYPRYIKDVAKEKLYNLSTVCLENALIILLEIERVYSEINNRMLSLDHLKEVMITPRVPDLGEHIFYDLSCKPTDYIRNELIKLKKIEAAFKDN